MRGNTDKVNQTSAGLMVDNQLGCHFRYWMIQVAYKLQGVTFVLKQLFASNYLRFANCQSVCLEDRMGNAAVLEEASL